MNWLKNIVKTSVDKYILYRTLIKSQGRNKAAMGNCRLMVGQNKAVVSHNRLVFNVFKKVYGRE